MTVLLALSMGCAVATVVTYYGLTTGRVTLKVYDYVNFYGAPLVIAYAALKHAWPSAFLSTSYLIAAGIGLWQKRDDEP